MPLDRISLRPGVNTMASPTLNSGGYSDASLVRFRGGLPEKWSGWVKFSTGLLIGACRSLVGFTELAGDKLLGAGTHNHLYVIRGGSATDVTPIDRTLTVAANGIATTNASKTVTVTFTGTHGATAGDYFTFDTITGTSRAASGLTVGGIPFAGDFVVTGLPSTTALTFTAASAATSSATGGGAASAVFFLPSGNLDNTGGLGWGAGGWGVAGWGLAATVAANTLPIRIVSLDSWGQTLLAVPTLERLYAWSPDAAGNITNRFAIVTNGTPANGPPLRIGQVLVGAPERHAILFGCSDLNLTANYDSMLVRWSDVEDYSTFKATSTNSAGSFRLQAGSEIRGAYNSNLQTLIWTDTALVVMRFIGLPYVYSFNQVGKYCGLIAQKAFGEVGGAIYWMGAKNFWRFNGGSAEQLDCPMLQEVFGRLNATQRSKVTCGVNTQDGEVIWFYPADGSSENSRYIAFNPSEASWYGGALSRTCWIDTELYDGPIAVTADGQLYQHETGNDADGTPMGDFIQTGYWDMSSGEQIMFASQIIPDFIGTDGGPLQGTLQISFQVKDYPNSPIRTRGPYAITKATLNRPFRARGRQIAMRIESVGTGSNWRMGQIRANYQPDGQR